MKNSDIMFFLTMFFAISILLGYTIGIKRMVIVWFVILLAYIVVEITFQYKKLLENLFD